MPDLNFQDFSTVQSGLQQKPVTMASAATITPVSFLTVLTGNVGIATITPPVSGTIMIALQFAGTAGVLATGNILTATASVVGQVMLLIWNPNTAKWVPAG
jgi:TRAP-type C4-dicarboxylate transport system permease large subunit